jgi:voltage-gated potassium channel Kch
VESSRSRRRDIEWVLLAAAAAAVVVLGYLGYRDAHDSPADRLYAALQLFVLEGGIAETGTPWQLEIARFLAPALVAYAAIRTALVLVHDRAMRLRVRLFTRRHVVVIGLTDTGFAVATQFSDRGRRVVVVEPESSSPRSTACVERGITVVHGDVTDTAVLAQTRPRRAADVVIAAGDDSLNLRSLAACEQVVAVAGRVPALHVEIVEPQLWSELHAIGLARTERPAVEFFSTADRAARALLDAATSELGGISGPVGVVVRGDGAVVTRLLIHITRRAKAVENDLLVFLAGGQAPDQLARVLEDAPWLAEAVSCTALGPGVSLPPDATLGFVCGLDDADALGTAAEISRELVSAQAAVWVAVSDPALAEALESTRLDLRRIHLVPATAAALGPALLSESAIELIARAKHEDYVARELQRGGSVEQNSSLVAWHDLPESLRLSNVRFAQSVASKLGDLGASLAPLSAPGAPYDLQIDHGDLEELARGEHDRWMRDLLEDGWRPTEREKDPDRKLHPLLVGWEQLKESDRDKDRDGFRAMPSLLARAGYKIVMPDEPKSQ